MNCPNSYILKKEIIFSLIFCLVLIISGYYGNPRPVIAADTTAPTIINVTSDSINKTFVTGNNVNVKVTFSEPVWLTYGYARVLLETGVTDRYATYTSGHSTNTLSFTYAIIVNDSSPDLDYFSTNSLDLHGDTIKDGAGNNAVLTLPVPGTSGSLGFNKNIVIDTVAPSVKVTSPLTGGHVNGNTLISFTDSEPTSPQCSINNSTWVNCVSGVSVFSGLTGFDLLSESTILTLYIRDTDSAGYTGNDNVTGLIKESAPPTLSYVHVSSGNSNPSWAKTGDSVTVTITSSRNISAPTVIIAGHTAQVSGTNTNWSGSYQMSANDSEGVVAFSVTFADTAGISGTTVSATTDGSTVTFDKTSPTATVSYSTQTFTAGSVTATISPSETVTITNNSGLVSYTFADNGSFTFNFSDAAGNTSSTTATVQIIDKTPPSSDLSGISDGWKREDVTLTFSCSDDLSGCGTTYYTTDGSAPTLNSSAGTMVTLSADGTYTIKYFTKDITGNVESVKTAVNQVRIDKTAPSGSLTSPASGALISGTITIAANASDTGGSGVSKVEFWNSSILTKIGDDSSSPYSTNWNTTSVLDGNHNIYLKIFDNAGNETDLTDLPVKVDNSPPVIASHADVIAVATAAHNTIVTYTPPTTSDTVDGAGTANCSPTFGSSFAMGTTPITCNATDAAGNVATSTNFNVTVSDTTPPVITLNGTSPVNIEVHSTYTDAGASALDNIDSDLTSAIVTVNSVNKDTHGTYTVTYNVSDSSGNNATQVSRTVNVIDTTAPTTTDNTDSNWHNINVTVTLSCSDAGSGCVNTYYTTDGTTPSTGSASKTSVTLTTDGTFTIKYFSVDNSSNSESVKTATNQVKIDKTNPSTTDSGTDTSWHNADVTVTLSCTDNAGGSSCTNTYNTTDGTTPTTSSLTTNSFTLTSDGTYTIKYFSKDGAGNSEPVKSATNIVKIDKTNTVKPTASITGGDYFSEQSVLLSSTDSGSDLDSLYYTTDGSNPSKSGSFFSPGLAVKVSKSLTLKAIAYDKAGNRSDIMTETYGIAPNLSSESSTLTTTTSAVITWTTDNPATSRVIYDTISHASLGSAPNYGYANSTGESDTGTKVTSHSVTISGLMAGTTYYYRVVSRGSPENASSEKTFKTAGAVLGTTIIPKVTATQNNLLEIPENTKIKSPVPTGKIKGYSTTAGLTKDLPTARVLRTTNRAIPFSTALLIPTAISFLLVTYFWFSHRSLAFSRKQLH